MSLLNSQLRVQVRQLYKAVMQRTITPIEPQALKRSAIVFSPHPDDETLGCGGTIIRKKNAGADVKVVFMTDGRRSHRHLLAEGDLKRIRAGEAVAANRCLGLAESDLFFLEFEDGRLEERCDDAIVKVSEVLMRQQPYEIFIPYYKETPLDHLATNKIVLAALQLERNRPAIYEYPIWFWRHWPWTSVPLGSRWAIFRFMKDTALANISLLSDFRSSIYIGDVLEGKRMALTAYKSQMTKLIPDSRWLTLGDVANGEFLNCFLQEYEIFHRYIFKGSDPCKNFLKLKKNY
jgi:LmbE family N-acetylglucosaminyl deacetylase